MIRVNVIADKKIWFKKIANPQNYFKKKLLRLSRLNTFKNKNQEFTLFLTNNKKMKDLNLKFRKKNKAADVLSFPLKFKSKKKSIYIGDIALSFDIINKRAKLSTFNLELDKMWIHGYLHLLGYDHRRNKDYKLMKMRENSLLKQINKIN
mgnify:CR=1 FL=1|tara:strand:- start:316 stop:765 length:450 start_codon:yes stop_codon:yes gene_type:complete